MGNFGGYFKGEKKKKKKGEDVKQVSFAPVFTLPKIVGKEKKEE